jgi:hypothetical protein
MTTSGPTPQDYYLQAVRQGQDAMVKAMQTWSDNVQRMMSGASSAGGRTATPEQIIDNVFGFAEQMLAAQKEFAKRLLQAGTAGVDAAQSATRKTTPTS